MARDYQIYKNLYDTHIKPAVENNAPTVAIWKKADEAFDRELEIHLDKAHEALSQLDGKSHAARYAEDLAQAGKEKKTGGDLAKHLSTLGTHLAAWEDAQTKHQATAKTHVDKVKDVYNRWTVAKIAQKDFRVRVADKLQKQMVDFDRSLSKEIAERKKKLSTKLSLGNKSLPSLVRLLHDAKQLNSSPEFKLVTSWRFDQTVWTKGLQIDIGRDVLGWEPVDIKQWHTTRVNEVKQALGLKDFKF